VKRWLYLDRLPTIARHDIGQLLLGMVLPGWSLLWSKQPLLGVILGTIYCFSAAVFLIWVGYPISNFALTVMISIHAGSILKVEQSIGLWKRILHSVLIFLAVAVFVYVPLRNQMERHWLMPLRINGRVVVIRTGRPIGLVRRGDQIAYRLPGLRLPGLWLREGGGRLVLAGPRLGCTLGRVMAVAGDEVAFRRDSILVNGELRPRSSQMPTNGTIYVDQSSWFIWPEMTISGDYAGAETIQQAMMQLAIVPESNYVGVLYQRWFWRKQVLP
jgi:hypothetical protein